VTEISLLDYLSCVPDFPKSGIVFRDISPLIADTQAFKFTITQLAHHPKKSEFTHISINEALLEFDFEKALFLSIT